LQTDTIEIKEMAVAAGEALDEQSGTAFSHPSTLHDLIIQRFITTAKLERVERGFGEINDELRKSERFLRSIKSFWGAVANLFRRRKYNKHKKVTDHTIRQEQVELVEEEEYGRTRRAHWTI